MGCVRILADCEQKGAKIWKIVSPPLSALLVGKSKKYYVPTLTEKISVFLEPNFFKKWKLQLDRIFLLDWPKSSAKSWQHCLLAPLPGDFFSAQLVVEVLSNDNFLTILWQSSNMATEIKYQVFHLFQKGYFLGCNLFSSCGLRNLSGTGQQWQEKRVRQCECTQLVDVGLPEEEWNVNCKFNS